MTKSELDLIIKDHKSWVKTNGAKGKRANLRDANLRDANLRDADLSHANLRDANLSHANLSSINLRDADLSHANLRDANLSYTNLSGINLSGINLRDANLSHANLRDANLRDADFDFASLPLWCGSFGMKVDDRLISQIFFHFAKFNIENCSHEVKKIHETLININKDFTNSFATNYRTELDKAI